MSQVTDFIEETNKLRRYPVGGDRTLDEVQRSFIAKYPNAYDTYMENPFILTTEFGLPFYYFRHRYGINDFTKSRILIPTFDMHILEVHAAIFDLLRQNEANGNSYIPFHDLFIQLRKFFNYTTNERIRAFFHYFRDEFYLKNERAAFLTTAKNEEYIYNKTIGLLDTTNSICSDFHFLGAEELCEEQNDAIRQCMMPNFSILTGGPGSGKTTTVRFFLAAFKENYPNRSVKLLAPTGKAARRLTESVHGYGEASTVDSLVFAHKLHRSQRETIDLCIIDEASMLSIDTFHDFLRYINPRKILLVGDVDQLPSIGAGNIFKDFIDMGATCAYLTINHRNGDTILDNSIKIKEKQTSIKFDEHFQFVEADREDMEEVACEYRNTNNDMILTPYRYEAQKINHLLHDVMFPNTYHDYNIGDRVMFLKNRKNKGYCNGDIGTVIDFIGKDMVVALDNDEMSEIYVSPKYMCEVTHAYGMTVHKAQGSEYDTVIILLPKGCSRVFSRKLLYTAVTRAKQNVILIGDRRELNKLILTSNENERLTFLGDYRRMDMAVAA